MSYLLQFGSSQFPSNIIKCYMETVTFANQRHALDHPSRQVPIRVEIGFSRLAARASRLIVVESSALSATCLDVGRKAFALHSTPSGVTDIC